MTRISSNSITESGTGRLRVMKPHVGIGRGFTVRDCQYASIGTMCALQDYVSKTWSLYVHKVLFPQSEFALPELLMLFPSQGLGVKSWYFT